MEYVNSAYIDWKNLPIQIKIMNFMLFKNIGTGLYIGIKSFTKSERPVSQLFENVISYTFFGVFEAGLWPITFTHFVITGLDKIALQIMDKKNTNKTN